MYSTKKKRRRRKVKVEVKIGHKLMGEKGKLREKMMRVRGKMKFSYHDYRYYGYHLHHYYVTLTGIACIAGVALAVCRSIVACKFAIA
jgi:ABC-type Zn2+ transport system substrate-binding protein/surface adhesin